MVADLINFISSFFVNVPQDNPVLAGLWFMTHGGFLLVVLPVLYFSIQSYKLGRQHAYVHAMPYSLLAVDVPKDTEQSPQAVEQIFAAVSSTYDKGTAYERWFKGRVIDSLSFEIVSLGGYIQFLVRTPTKYFKLVTSAIYAQYPNAEVTEVEDYVDRIPIDFDTEAYDLWGTEFELMKHWVYPIRTYPEFEHTLSQDFKDPMAQLLEVLGSINPDEDIWLQLVVTATREKWRRESDEEVKKIIEKKSSHGLGLLRYFFWTLPTGVAYDLFESVIAGIFEPAPQYAEKEQFKNMNTVMNLTPGERKIVEAIEHKASKLGYWVKFRMVYWGRRETFQKGLGVSAVVGAVQQFTTLDLNGYKPSDLLTTQAEYFLRQSRINTRQRRILRHYKSRSTHFGLGHGFILNTEELATLYHFPVITVKAPLVKKTESKKAEPPFALPTLRRKGSPAAEETVGTSAEPGVKGSAPGNIPFVD